MSVIGSIAHGMKQAELHHMARGTKCQSVHKTSGHFLTGSTRTSGASSRQPNDRDRGWAERQRTSPSRVHAWTLPQLTAALPSWGLGWTAAPFARSAPGTAGWQVPRTCCPRRSYGRSPRRAARTADQAVCRPSPAAPGVPAVATMQCTGFVSLQLTAAAHKKRPPFACRAHATWWPRSR